MRDHDRLTSHLERLGLLLRSDDRRVGGRGALQPIHLALLRYLARANRFSDTPRAAVAYLGQTKGTVSQSLGVLERRGYLKKRPDPRDGRMVHLELTAKGRRAARNAPASLAAASQGLGRDEVAAAADLLERLLRGLQEASGGRSFGACETCRYLAHDGPRMRCTHFGVPLASHETELICEQHVWRSGET